MNNQSIVEYFGSQGESTCGYCKSATRAKYTHGMWTHTLTVDDYQALIDRGWRRCGKYTYKPTLSQTCCPQYTIRCDATQFKLLKSQKRVLKRLNKFISDDQKHMPKAKIMTSDCNHPEILNDSPKLNADNIQISSSDIDSPAHLGHDEQETGPKLEPHSKQVNAAKPYRPDLDPDKPKTVKSKLRRRQMKIEKLIAKGLPGVLSERKNLVKSVEDFIYPAKNANHIDKHQFNVRLVRSHPESEEFKASFDESFALYKKYQIGIHKDSENHLSERGFRKFLCDSPLIPRDSQVPEHPGYGSFHQQYFLDGKLVAVGVLDLLPCSISAKYFYYDPQFSFLCFGIYSALREIALVRQLARLESRQIFYYMGYYIHTCQKMKYKAHYRPSWLLCPEAYTWVSIEKCMQILNETTYSRFEENKNLSDSEGNPDINRVLILNDGTLCLYPTYVKNTNNAADDREEVKEYANLVGKKCAYSMCLYRS